MKNLTIVRSNEYFNAKRDYEIYVDNQMIGTIANGATKTFEIPENAQEIYAKIDWCRSQKINIQQVEQPVQLKVSAFKYNRVFLIGSILVMILNALLSTYTDFQYELYLLLPILGIFVYIFTFGSTHYLSIKTLETD